MKEIKDCNLRKWGSRFKNEIFNFLFELFKFIVKIHK